MSAQIERLLKAANDAARRHGAAIRAEQRASEAYAKAHAAVLACPASLCTLCGENLNHPSQAYRDHACWRR